MFCACEKTTNTEESEPPSDGATVQEIIIEEELITKEAFIEYIQTHDVGLSVEDFEGIDIEDFIAFWQFTPSDIGEYLWQESLEVYKRDLELKEKAKCLAITKISVESTDEEYKKFIKDFFIAIGKKDTDLSQSRQLGFYCYDVMADGGGKVYIYITQTKYIDELNISRNPNRRPELLEVFIPDGPDGAGTSGNLCYSKNKKYMMLVSPVDDELFEYAKIFCEIYD